MSNIGPHFIIKDSAKDVERDGNENAYKTLLSKMVRIPLHDEFDQGILYFYYGFSHGIVPDLEDGEKVTDK